MMQELQALKSSLSTMARDGTHELLLLQQAWSHLYNPQEHPSLESEILVRQHGPALKALAMDEIAQADKAGRH